MLDSGEMESNGHSKLAARIGLAPCRDPGGLRGGVSFLT